MAEEEAGVANGDPFPPPDHPDFALIMDKVHVLGDMSRSATTVEEFVATMARFGDMASSDAVAYQRAILLVRRLPFPLPDAIAHHLALSFITAWTEGYYVGNMVNGERFAEAEKVTIPDTPEGL